MVVRVAMVDIYRWELLTIPQKEASQIQDGQCKSKFKRKGIGVQVVLLGWYRLDNLEKESNQFMNVPTLT